MGPNLHAITVLVVSSSALLIVLSGFEGLKDFGMAFYDQFEPDFKIIPKNGKTLKVDEKLWKDLLSTKGILSSSRVIEEKVFFGFEGKNQAAYIKGVSSSYTSTSPVDSLVVIGEWIDFDSNSVVLGYGLSSSLGVGVYDYSSYLELSAPKKGKLKFKGSPFVTMPAFVNGIFQISEDIDKKYAFCSIDFARKLLSFEDDEFCAKAIVDKMVLEKEINDLFTSEVVVLDKKDLNPALYKMLNTENLAVYLIFSLVALISMFNLVGSLTIMMVEKKKDLRVLKVLGGQEDDFNKIFFTLGVFTSVFGALLGIFIGWVIILAQNTYSLILVPGTSIPYPVSLTSFNVLVVFLTIFFLGLLTSAWSTHKGSRS